MFVLSAASGGGYLGTICYTVFAIVASGFFGICNGHGRLIEPPSRASAWRYGFQTPPNYNDHELYCGGFTRQWKKNDGKCGECGDPWDVPMPRPHEFGGKWGQGVIVRKYKPGGDITLRIELTASHMGYFEFRICPEITARQACLDKHLLRLISGTPSSPQPNDLETRFYPRNGSRIYDIRGVLPNELECGSCVLQWRYIAGNNWGVCDDGNGAVGCGPQEEFRACADIAIGDLPSSIPVRPTRPGTKTTSKAKGIGGATVQPEPGLGDETEGPRYVGALIALIALLVVLCLLAGIYLYHYHGQRIKQLMQWKHEKCVAPQSSSASSQISLTRPLASQPPPVPPPRTKRLSGSLALTENVQELSPTGESTKNNSNSNSNSNNNTCTVHSPECA